MQKYLLDTNTIIYAINKGVTLPKGEYFVSIITEIELLSYSNLTKSEEKVLKKVLKNFEIIYLTDEVKINTIETRKNSKIKLPDSIILASAYVQSAVLVTSDKQLVKFKSIQTIELEDLLNI